MIGIIGVLGVTAAILLFELPSLLKDHSKKEVTVFLIVLVFGVGVSIAQVLEVKLPNPMDAIVMVYQPLSDFLMNMLK